MFEQKGLFQADVSIHHALCTTALHNYHTSVQQLQTGGRSDPFGGPAVPESASQAQLGHSELPGNEWGFERGSEQVAGAQEGFAEEVEAEAECPVVRLPHLQVFLFAVVVKAVTITVVITVRTIMIITTVMLTVIIEKVRNDPPVLCFHLGSR